MGLEHQKTTNLLNAKLDNVPRSITKKWIEFHNQSDSVENRYKPNKQIRFKTSILLRSDLCDFSDAYIVVKGDITLKKDADKGFIDIRNRSLAFKNNAPFTNCISKINNVLIDNAEDLDVVMLMYNLFEYSKNYRKTRRSLWNYLRDEPNNLPLNLPVVNNPPTFNYNADPITNSESFKYKSSITGKTSNANQENSENTVKTLSKEIQRLRKILKLLFH